MKKRKLHLIMVLWVMFLLLTVSSVGFSANVTSIITYQSSVSTDGGGIYTYSGLGDGDVLELCLAGDKGTKEIASPNLPVIAVEKEVIEVYLLGGQSNMDGRADNNGLVTELQQPQANVQIHFERQWYDLQPGLSYSYFGQRFGPEVTFGHTLANIISDPNEKIALVKYARGGTNLAIDWYPGTGSQYDSFVTEVNHAMDTLAEQYIPVIVGMIWMQGESDALNSACAHQYEQNLTCFIQAVRTDLSVSDMPFIIGQISESAIYGTCGEIVRQAQLNVSQTVANTSLVVTSDLGLQDDYHYDPAGTIELGTRFADAIIQMEMVNPCGIWKLFSGWFEWLVQKKDAE